MSDIIPIRTSTPRRKVTPHLVYKVKVELLDAPYPIWREVLFDGECDLATLQVHLIHSLGYEFSHMFKLEVDDKDYQLPRFTLDFDDDSRFQIIDATKCTLQSVFTEKTIGILIYDFGDYWQHEVSIVEILPDSQLPTPYCTRGQGACPPDDCGAMDGFINMLETLKDPDSDEYEETIEWLGREFKPSDFDIKQANKFPKKFKMTR